MLYIGEEDFVPLANQSIIVTTGQINCTTLTLLSDSLIEGDEQFMVTVVVTEPDLADSSSASMIIIDNDGKPADISKSVH